MIYTVFPKEDGEMPQDFDTYSEARDFADEEVQHGHIILTLGKLTENVKGRKRVVFALRKKQKQHLPRL